MENTPFFSVVIAAYNSERYIVETLESVNNQTLNDFEVIIIDDASTDSTYDVIQKYIEDKELFFLYRNSQNIGVADSRNRGFKYAKGKYIALLDADDLWSSQKLEKQYRLLLKTNADITYSSYELINEDSKLLNKIYKTKERASYKSLLKENYIGCSSAVFKSNVVDNIMMDSGYAHEDFAFWLECLRNGCVAIGLTEPLMQYRILRGSRSFNKFKALRGRARILHERESLSSLKVLYFILLYSLNGVRKYWSVIDAN